MQLCKTLQTQYTETNLIIVLKRWGFFEGRVDSYELFGKICDLNKYLAMGYEMAN